MENCIFCDNASGKVVSHRVWEDEKHLAFLSINPNTKGLTVVLPKMHVDSYIFNQDQVIMNEIMAASKKVASILDNFFEDVGRTGLIFEGFGVNHLHAKLIPMHGTKLETWQPIKSQITTYFEKYEGYISSHDSDIANDSELAELAEKIRESSRLQGI